MRVPLNVAASFFFFTPWHSLGFHVGAAGLSSCDVPGRRSTIGAPDVLPFFIGSFLSSHRSEAPLVIFFFPQ